MITRFTLSLLAGLLAIHTAPAQTASKPPTDALGDALPDGALARLGTLRFKHAPAANEVIVDAAFTVDGKKIVSLAGGQGSIRVWDAGSGLPIQGVWNTSNNGPNSNYTAIAVAPDGKFLAAAINPGFRPNFAGNGAPVRPAIVLYDLAAGKRWKTLSAQAQLVRSLRFADGGKTLLAGGDGMVRWWDVATGKEVRSWKPFADESPKVKGNVRQMKTFSYCEISPDAKFLAVQVGWQTLDDQTGGMLQRYRAANVTKEAVGFDLTAHKKYWQTAGNGSPYDKSHFAFSADGRRVAIALGSDKVEVRDGVTGKLTRDPLGTKLTGDKRLGALALSDDGTMVAVASKASLVQLWATASAGPPRALTARVAQNGADATVCVRFAPDGKTLAVGVDADLQLYDVATLAEVHPWEGHRGWVDHLAFTADGKQLLTGSSGRGRSGGEYFGPNGEIYYLVTAGHAAGVPSPEQAAWDTSTWKRTQLTTVHAPPWPNFGSTSLARAFYVGKAGEDRFALYDMRTGQLTARMRGVDKQRVTRAGYFSPSGKHFVESTSDNRGQVTERVFAVPSGKLVCQLPQPKIENQNGGTLMMGGAGETSGNLAFSRDETLVAQYGRGDGLIHVFETASGEPRHSVGTKLVFDEEQGFNPYNYELAFSGDNKYLASWTNMDNALRVWDLASGVELARRELTEQRPKNRGFYGAQLSRFQLAWSPDNRILAGGERKITLWELATLSIRRELPGHGVGSIRALEFSPDGQVLASASSDTTVLIWDLAMRRRTPLAAGALTDDVLQKRWQDLSSVNAAKALSVALDLIAAPKETVAWIVSHIKPARAAAPDHVAKLIQDLNDSQFKVRQSATADLVELGDRVVPAVAQVLAGKPPLETQLRLQDIRKRVTSPLLRGEQLQAVRAFEILERIATPEARRALQTLADGAPGARITVQAQAALQRLQKIEQNAVASSQ